jgi:hypothetical protein
VLPWALMKVSILSTICAAIHILVMVAWLLNATAKRGSRRDVRFLGDSDASIRFVQSPIDMPWQDTNCIHVHVMYREGIELTRQNKIAYLEEDIIAASQLHHILHTNYYHL